MEITVLTYNIHKAIGNDRRFFPERIAEVCADTGADIVALQEVDNGVPRSRHMDLAAVLADHLSFHYKFGANVQLKEGEYGNATLSRWPIVFSENIDLSWTIKKKRGCLGTLIETPAGELLSMNFHLGLSRIERHFQIKKLLEAGILCANTDLPTVLLGDTNERTRYMDLLLTAAGHANTAGESKRKFKTWPSFAPIWNLDKIFHNSRCELVQYEVIRTRQTRLASDHLPVRAILKI